MKLKILGEQFEAERNVKTYKLKPKIIGCIWQGPGNSFPESSEYILFIDIHISTLSVYLLYILLYNYIIYTYNYYYLLYIFTIIHNYIFKLVSVPTKVKEFLSARQAWVNNLPIIFPSSATPEEAKTSANECKMSAHQQSVRGAKKTKFPDEALSDLIRLVHGNRHGRHVLMREFMTFWSKKGGSHLSKVSVLSKINEIADRIACPDEGPMHLKSCWYVPEDIRKQYLPDVELSLPNRWKYICTMPSRKSDTQNVTDKIEKEEKDKEKDKKHIPLITQFTKKITQKEMKKQLAKSDLEEMKKQSIVTPSQKETKKQSIARSDQEEINKQSTEKPDQEETKKQSASKSDQIPILPKLPPLQRPPKRATLISVGRGEQFPEKSRQNMLAKFVSLNKKKEESLSSEKMIDSENIRLVKDNDMDKTN